MTSRVQIMVALVVSVARASGAAGQGLYWESKTTGAGNALRTAQTYAMPKMMKIVNSEGKVLILRADQDKFITADTAKQTYRELTFSQMEAAGKSMQAHIDAARAEMEKRMKDKPPEQRAMMEKMFPQKPGAGGSKPSTLVVKDTGETKIISGYSCTKYVATEDGKTVLVAWTTKDVKGFEGLRDDWVGYQKRLEGTNRSFGSAMAEAYAKIEGFPMQTEMGEITTVVTKVEPRTTAASEFEAPAGYTKESVNLPKPPPQR